MNSSIAIMQPYLFPYIGYFQLIKAVNTFIAYDDVHYIKQGWINRNFILLNGRKYLFTLQVISASSFKLINQTAVGGNMSDLIKTLHHCYRKAPYFNKVFPLIEDCLNHPDRNLANYVVNSIRQIAIYLNIETRILNSSDLVKDNTLHAQEKVLNICKIMKAGSYINAIGGRNLYSKVDFDRNNIILYFLKSRDIEYRQFDNLFVPNLSIIDVLMFNAIDEVKNFLKQYDLIRT